MVLVLSLVTIGVYTIAWIYRLQQEHPRREKVDPPAAVWVWLFVALTLLLFAAFAASGYGMWTHWTEANPLQRGLFLLGLAVAVLFNVWFGIGSLRLTDRFQQLLDHRQGTGREWLQKVLLTFGLGCEMTAMVCPPAIEVGIIQLPTSIDLVMRTIGSLGAGSLFAWGIELHLQANELAMRASRGR